MIPSKLNQQIEQQIRDTRAQSLLSYAAAQEHQDKRATMEAATRKTEIEKPGTQTKA